MQEMDTGGSPPVFRPLEVKVTSSYPAQDVLTRNVRLNMVRDWPRFYLREDYGKAKNKPIAICAGGPSLMEYLDKIDDFEDVMVCGSAHDYLISENVIPTYSVQLDGGVEAKKFFNYRHSSIQYLMASQCDQVMFTGLPRHQVSMWHAVGCVDKEHFNGDPAIGGGCTTTLRAMCVAIMLGYHDLHMFGFDSCFEDVNNQHAYDYEEWGSNLSSFLVNVDGGRAFTSNGLFLAQAQQFQEMCKNFGHMFEPHVYGDGLIAHMINVGKLKTGEQK